MYGIVGIMVVGIVAGGTAARPAGWALRCNSTQHGVVRGGPWAQVGGPYNHERTCERAMPGHRGAAHGGDMRVVLRCARGR